MAIAERISYRGEQWTRVPAQDEEAFVVGLDLGQSRDPSAIAVVHHRRTPLDVWSVDHEQKVTRQDVEEVFDVRYLKRLALATPYPEQCARVREILARPPLRVANPALVIDETGVGKAVGDIFDGQGMMPVRCIITAGFDVKRHGARRFAVPKSQLVSGLDAALHRGALRFAKELLEADALKDELANFQRHVTAAGRSIFEARSGKHDDLVLAVAIALWWAQERQRRARHVSFGSLRGLA